MDVAEPLRGRMLRFWPQAVTDRQTNGPFALAVAASPEGRGGAQVRADEELRLLYVAWTRARDRLVLAARPDRLGEGALAALKAKGLPLVREPMVRATWGKKVFDVVVRDGGPLTQLKASAVTVEAPGRYDAHRVPARVAPSTLVGTLAIRGSVSLGEGLPSALGNPKMLGDAIHRFFAADDHALPPAAREELAARVLGRWPALTINPGALVRAHGRLLAYLETRFPGATASSGVLISRPLMHGRLVGEADLVLVAPNGWAVVDHKVVLSSAQDLSTLASAAGAQVAAYGSAIAAQAGAWPSLFVHFPIQGRVFELEPPDLATEPARDGVQASGVP